MANDDLAALLEATRASLLAFQQNQERTAIVHAEFLKAHAAATESFARMFEAHTRLVEGASAGGSLPVSTPPAVARTPVSLPSVAAPPIEATHEALAASIIQPTASSRIELPQAVRPTVAAEDDLPPMLDAHTLSAIVKGGAPAPGVPAPAPAVAVPEPAVVDVGEALLAAVGEKTGYPRDLLDLSMNLESDLGIDSIKRVEILSAVKDAIPTLPDGDDEAVGSLRTLDEVRVYLEELLGAARAA